MSDRLLTTREVCRRLGISIRTLQVLRSNRKIAYLRFGHRSIRFREQAIEEFLQRREKAVNFAGQTQKTQTVQQADEDRKVHLAQAHGCRTSGPIAPKEKQ